jgi:alpha-galactosidase
MGHAEHSKPADESKGMPGKMPRPIKVTMMGAGSFFTQQLVNDVLQIPGADRGEIALVDIDRSRLTTVYRLIRKLMAELDRPGWKVSASTDRREVLKGTDYLINCIEVSGLQCVRYDNDIPARYGVDQCIGDTIGPGGLFKALRTIPSWLEILKDVEALCPHALVLNYTNPMNMMCLAAGRTSPVAVVGLCHSVQGTSHLLAKRAGVPYEEMEWECAGINHLAWFTKLARKNKDLYPLLMEKARRDLAGKPTDPEDAEDLIRKDVMLQFGAFVTESSGHLSEYLPYYRKRRDVLRKYCGKGYHGESGFYSKNWPFWRKRQDDNRLQILKGAKPMVGPRSWEYSSWIVEAREKDVPYRIYGNVMNTSKGQGELISNLHTEGCVEVACMVDRGGIHATRFGKLPPQMAALCEADMRMFDLGVTAAILKSKEAVVHALLLDPLTAAVCSPAEIRQMTEKLFKAEQKFLPGYN